MDAELFHLWTFRQLTHCGHEGQLWSLALCQKVLTQAVTEAGFTDNEIARKRQQGLDDDWPGRVDPQFAPAGRLIAPEEIAAVVVTFLSDECGPISGQVCDLEQYPLLGRNPPKTIQPSKEA